MPSGVAFCDVHERKEIAVQRCQNHRPHYKYVRIHAVTKWEKILSVISFVKSCFSLDTGRPLSKAEFERARRTPPRLPDPSHPKHRAPPIDRPPYWNRNYLSYTFLRWPNRRVPYTIDSGFNDAQRTVIAQVRIMFKFKAFSKIILASLSILQAIQHIEDAACVRFYPKTGQDQVVQNLTKKTIKA